MNILAIDTATEILGVTLAILDPNSSSYPDHPLSGRTFSVMRDIGLRHSRFLMPLVDQLLGDAGLEIAEIDLVACSRGPGSFTGLRIGMSTAKGIATAVASLRGLDAAPLVSVPTLAVIAYPLQPVAAMPDVTPAKSALVLPVIDARKERFYAALFSEGRRLTDDLDLPGREVLQSALGQSEDSPILVTGPHLTRFLSVVQPNPRLLADPEPRRNYSASLVPLALKQYIEQGADTPDQGPVYVRASDAELGAGSR